jgi:hypothetical protein
LGRFCDAIKQKKRPGAHLPSREKKAKMNAPEKLPVQPSIAREDFS